ncbi:MerR family transcriptional regulator [Vallitalea okinawensis]|uniref:MerR family transcriptional regulator n=1 Tax=Vallitalea okinawensis TaxID=2078660 RepID=UPI000CFB1F1C|nr:MerR family transcriptional regulator [Vallitalea okinawensis]
MYTIGEFSKIGKVSTKMLRHYDKIGLLLPEKINDENGYRYYSHNQVKDIIMINKLKRYKFSLKEIGDLMVKKDNHILQHAMKQKLKEIQKEMLQYQLLAEQMVEEIDHLEQGGPMIMAREFKIMKQEQEDMILVTAREKISMDEIGRLMSQVMENVYRNQLEQAGPIITKYYDEDFDRNYTDIEVCVPVNKELEGITKRHQGKLCVYTEFVGPYSEISEAYAVIIDYMKENNLKTAAAPYEKYLKGPGSDVTPKDFVTEVYFPVSE